MAISLVQQVRGTVGSSTTPSVTLSTPGAGNLLIAITGRSVSSGNPSTIGYITDTVGANPWRQGVEYCAGVYGADIWICEQASAAGAPAITGNANAFPSSSYVSSVEWGAEFSGLSGMELPDCVGQAAITTTSVTVTGNKALALSNELQLSVVVGNFSAATVPAGWTSLGTGSFSGAFSIAAAYLVGGSSGATPSAAWTGLTGGSAGTAILLTLRPAGVSASTIHLRQSAYWLPGITTPPVVPWTSPSMLATTGAGNALVVGATSGNYRASPATLTDSTGDTFTRLANNGGDPNAGVDWSLWVASAITAGTPTFTVNNTVPAYNTAIWVAELTHTPTTPTRRTFSRNANTSTWSVTTPQAAAVGDCAFGIMSWLFQRSCYPSTGWSQVMSDTAGCGHADWLSSVGSAAALTWAPVGTPSGGTDILMVDLRPSSGP